MKFFKEKPNISGRAIFLLWFRLARKFFVFLFFVVIGIGSFVWYTDVYRGEWTPEERRTYADATFKETVFNEVEFRKSVDAAKRRSDFHAEDVVVGNDFFVPLPETEKQR